MSRKLRRRFEISVLLSLFILVFVVVTFNSLNLVYPSGDIEDRSPEFEWYGNYEEYNLLVDDDNSFDNPLLDVKLIGNSFNYDGELDIGEYYWKVIGTKDGKLVESSVFKFGVKSVVAYSIRDNILINKGNTKSKLGSITGDVVLDPNRGVEIDEGGNYTLEQL
jgi:hypothetical protein